MWCDMIWCNILCYMIWYDVMLCDMILHDVILNDVMWYHIISCDVMWYERWYYATIYCMIWYVMIWDMMWCDMMWDLMWYDITIIYFGSRSDLCDVRTGTYLFLISTALHTKPMPYPNKQRWSAYPPIAN